MQRLIAAALLALLTACAAPTTTPAPSAPAAPLAVPVATLVPALAALPGAEALEGEVGVGYPGEVLFAAGAVLPLPGGLELLDPLAEVLHAHPGNRWSLRVRAATEHGKDYDLALAEGRAGLLQRFFTRRGISAERLDWQVAAEDGAPLEVRPLP
ncbi:hypothetical protein [Geoalkalibacter sp.]|uniref:hypothetical protein n=1 Tax=Geoalkalibacter sp. TaxID=3041440 RepID=UPI00272E9845|nr:hypothetical protein [Geoalkalibacter sp.]